MYTFDDYAEYNVSASYLESGNVAVSNGTITITKSDSEIILDKTVFDYGDSINVATMGAVGITAKIDGNDVTVVDFTIPLSGLNAGTYNLTVTTIPDEDHNPVTATSKITINKVESTLTVDNIEFDKFDYVLYNMGNSSDYHSYIYETALKHPGIIIQHDLVLLHFIWGYYKENKKSLFSSIYERFSIEDFV